MNAISQAVAHAYLPPSGAGTWRHCAAAPGMWSMFPERGADKEAAEEGTAAHWVFAEKFTAGHNVDVGEIAPNGVVVTEEMIEGAAMFVEVVYASAGENQALHVEEPVAIPSVHVANWGTPDVWFYDPVRRVIHVLDYKFGFGYVDVFENWQLIDYVAGIMDSLGFNGTLDQQTRVAMTIVQPRSYHRDGPVRTWSVLASELRAHINILRSAAERVMSPNPPATTNDGCKHCSGRHACTALQLTAYEAAELSLVSLPDEMTPAARALELRTLRRAEARLAARVSGLEDSVQADLARGEPVPFFGLEQTVGRLAWTVPIAQVEILGRMLKVDLSKPGVLAPTQAKEKVRKAGFDPAILATYADNPRGAMKLVPVDSKTARKVFQK